ncbi:MAG: hypothetical protein VX910_03160 [Candidatus Latescibacterota bacterium]|nr:hypothetical protein [Candidatus Latescibacterota bacterium]
MKRKRIITLVCLLVGLQSFIACRPIPTEPELAPGEVRDRTFTSDDWGFSITVPPDSLWSLRAIQRFYIRESNGLSPVQVIMYRANPGFPNRPVVLLDSFGRAEGQTLEISAALFETQFEQSFVSYNVQGQKTSGVIGGVESVEWVFRAREPQSGPHVLNNRFLSVIFQRGDQVYQIVCSGQQGNFPEAEFRGILGTFAFIKP